MIIKPVKPLKVIFCYQSDLNEDAYKKEYNPYLNEFLSEFGYNPTDTSNIEYWRYSNIHQQIIHYDSDKNIMELNDCCTLFFKNWVNYHIILNDGFISKNLGGLGRNNPAEAIQELIDHLQGNDNTEGFVDLDNIVF